MQYIKVHDWEQWQSYRKDRGQPPWIKVHRSIMRDPKWVSLTDTQRGQLVQIWLLAADRDGEVPNDAKMIQKLCFMSSTPDLKLFISNGFLDGDANMTPTWRQHGANMTHQNRREEKRGEERREETSSPPIFSKSQYRKILNALKSQKPKARIDIKDNHQFEAIEKLIRLDGYTDKEVFGCLMWVFTSQDKDAVFWCQNVSSFIKLREKKSGDTMTKFDKIFTAYQKTTKPAAPLEQEKPLNDVDLMKMVIAKYFPGKDDQKLKTGIAEFFDTHISGKIQLSDAKRILDKSQSAEQFKERIKNARV